MTRKRLLFALAGAGAGNASRTAAILEELDHDRFDVALLAQSPRRWSALQRFTRYPLSDVTYGHGEFTTWRILSRNTAFPLRYWTNRHRAGRAIDDFKPDLLVLDSDFYSLPEARRRGIPIVSINSSPATLAVLKRMPRPGAGFAFSYCVEWIDRWLQRGADRVLCPVFGDVDTGVANARLVAPVVRRQFRQAAGARASDQRFDVGVMLGGSGLGTSTIDLSGVEHSIVVIGASGGRYPGHAVHLPFSDQPAAILSRCRVIVIQGGFNSVSEAMALGKPTVIIPIPNHLEQWVNAWWAGTLGFGLVAEGPNTGDAVTRLLREEAQWSRPPARCDGATEVAALIGDMARA